MGMEVYGLNPSSPAGSEFWADIWTWPVIHALIVECCSDLFDEEELAAMQYNDGAGPRDEEICTEMANRFEAWLNQQPEGCGVALPAEQVPQMTQFVSQFLDGNPNERSYQIGPEHLKKWIEFLRHCGGFEVC